MVAQRDGVALEESDPVEGLDLQVLGGAVLGEGDEQEGADDHGQGEDEVGVQAQDVEQQPGDDAAPGEARHHAHARQSGDHADPVLGHAVGHGGRQGRLHEVEGDLADGPEHGEQRDGGGVAQADHEHRPADGAGDDPEGPASEGRAPAVGDDPDDGLGEEGEEGADRHHEGDRPGAGGVVLGQQVQQVLLLGGGGAGVDGLPEVGQRLDGVDVLDAGVGEVVLELDGLH